MDDLISLDRKNIWHPFTPLGGNSDAPLITKAEGIYLYTSDGRRILDAVSSWWVNLHGHGNPMIAQAIATQAAKLEHVIFAGFTHEPAIELSRNLLTILPESYGKIFFSDNGSTAVEVALKMAIQYWHNLGKPRKKIIAMKGAYHGDTFGSMSVAERGLFTEPFFPFLFETEFIDFPTADQEENVLRELAKLTEADDVAAFIVEPLVQAAGGMRMYSPAFLDRALAIAKDAEILCIADEVFTGFGRTGKMLAVDHLTHKPDIITLSKGITGGFMPLGVTACSSRVVEAFQSPSFEKTFFHGHSYTANPLACAAANASFRLLMESDCQARIRRIEELHRAFSERMATHKRILDVRTLGTILAVELRSDEGSAYQNSMRKAIYPYFLSRDILLRPLGNVLYILPPYVITDDELTSLYQAIEEFLETL